MKILLSVVLLGLSGCSLQNSFKHFSSSLVGLNRRITLFGADGHVIRSWDCRCKVEMKGGDAWFVSDEGKAIAVMGTVLVEEL